MYVEHPYKFNDKFYAKVDGKFYEITKEVAKANVVDVIEVFMAFSKWIEYRSTIDPEVTPELVRAINKYQDLYITEQMGIK